jgi:hypothetical protein
MSIIDFYNRSWSIIACPHVSSASASTSQRKFSLSYYDQSQREIINARSCSCKVADISVRFYLIKVCWQISVKVTNKKFKENLSCRKADGPRDAVKLTLTFIWLKVAVLKPVTAFLLFISSKEHLFRVKIFTFFHSETFNGVVKWNRQSLHVSGRFSL